MPLDDSFVWPRRDKRIDSKNHDGSSVYLLLLLTGVGGPASD